MARIEFGFDEASGYDRDRGWGRDEARDADTGRPVIPRGMRERQVVVLANERWLDTGIDVREGQTVYFASGGEVRWGPRRKDGPAGERNSRPHELRPIPDRPAAALIGIVPVILGGLLALYCMYRFATEHHHRPGGSEIRIDLGAPAERPGR